MVPGVPRLAFAGVSPNPAMRDLRVMFELGSGAAARLELLDLAGRRRAAFDVTAMGPGRHAMTIPAAGLAPGIYLLRLTQNGEERHARCAVIR